MGSKQASGSRDARDVAHWDAVEEAGELLVERDYEAALTALRGVIQSDPNNPYAYQLLGGVLWELKQLEPARDAYRAAVLLAPAFLSARAGLAHTLRKLGDLTGAEREARVALRTFPDDGELHHVLGLVLGSRGHRRQARLHLEKFLGSKPEIEAAMEARQMLELLTEGEDGEPIELDAEDDE